MLANLFITILISSQILLPAVAGDVLGVTTTQLGGDEIKVRTPQRIINKNLGVNISAQSAVAVDADSGKILFFKNENLNHPIASITKLMTALVFLDTNPDLERGIEIKFSDLNHDGKTNLKLGEKVKVKDLLPLSLIASDNEATLALVRSTGMTRDKFVEKMNQKVLGLGLKKTHFTDPVGLSKKNISNSLEVVRILNLAMNHNFLKRILIKKDYKFNSLSKKYHFVKSTDKLLNSYLKILGGKTGYTEEAGYCFTSLIKLKNGSKIFTVVLGAPKAEGRFQDTKAIVNWVEENYIWK